MANPKREEFGKRIGESRSEEYVSPPLEIAKSHSNVEFGNSADGEKLRPPGEGSESTQCEEEDSKPIELVVPEFSPISAPKSNSEGSRRNQKRNLLKQAYYSLLLAILDPIAYLREKHNFELKVLTKIAKCDGCHGVVWGIHRQGLQCTKCYLSIHEKCRELVQENCMSSASGGGTGTTGRKARRSLKLDDSMLQLELVNRYQDIKSTYPNYLNRVKEVFACVMSDDFRSDIKQTQQSFIQKSVKQIRTRLRIHVISASDLLAKDSCGTSDPYVTIQCGFSRLKRTRTRKKNLNPVWNEVLEFEFVNTADGIVSDSGNCGSKMIVRVWDEDTGLKAQLDKMLTNEQDDFLGQIVLDLNDLSLDVEETYRLQPRHDGSHVSGFLVMKIECKVVETLSNYRTNELGSDKSLKMMDSAQSASYFEEYRCLHRHLFGFILEMSDTGRDEPFSQLIDTTWLLHCFPKTESYKVNYFKEPELNLMLKHFANKYAVTERQKQLIHLECFYTFFFDSVYYQNVTSLVSMRRLYSINCQLLDFTTQLVSSVCKQCLGLDAIGNETAGDESTGSPKKSQNQIIGSFIKKTLALPLKIVLLLSDFRSNFSVKYRVRRGGRIELVGGVGDGMETCVGETAIDELREMVLLFRAVCVLVEKIASVNSVSLSRFEQIEAKCAQKYDIVKPKFGYDTKTQFELIKQAIEKSLISSFYTYFQPPLGRKDHSTEIFDGIQSHLSNMSDDRRCSSRSTDSSLSYVKPRNEPESTPYLEVHPASIHLVASRVELLIGLIAKKLPIEIELNEQFYFSAFYSFNEQFNRDFGGGFRQFCCRVLFKQFMFELQNTLDRLAFIGAQKVIRITSPLALFKVVACILKILNYFQKSELALRMQLDLIKQHLNLHLLVKRFLIENGLAVYEKEDLAFSVAFLSELFQPFLLEYIRLQEDQFIKYAHKIYDVSRINQLAEEIARMIEHNRVILLSMSSLEGAGLAASTNGQTSTNMANLGSASLPYELVDKYSIDVKSTKAIYELENFYSASVTDFFTIMHELLQTLLSFDSSDPKANLPHQMGFVNLIKSKLLGYSAHVKKEFQRIYNEARNQRRLKSHMINIDEADKIYPSNQLTITSCILMNNFQKTIEFLKEIEPKLTNKSKLNRSVVDQLESIRLILKEDLDNMVIEYTHEYEQPLLDACKYFQIKMYMDRKQNEARNGAHHIAQMKNLIDQSLFNIFNDRFMICKIILFDEIFKQLLEQIFKLTVKCVESSIILSRDAGQHMENRGDSSELESSESSSSSSQHESGSSSIAAAGLGLFSRLGTLFHRTAATTTEKTDLHSLRDKSLLNDFQYKTIQQYLKNVVEFFSGDEEFLRRDHLTNTNEYQSALKTLDLYLNSSNQLISSFVRTQNIQQNNIDFRQCYGKIRVQIELKQNAKVKSELCMSVRALEGRSIVWSQPASDSASQSNIQNGFSPSSTLTTIYMEIYAFGPFQTGKNWPVKIVPATLVDADKKIVLFGDESGVSFDFKITISSSEAKRLSESVDSSANSPSKTNDDRKILESYELQFVLREIVTTTGHTNIIGVGVFNLSESIQSAHVWRRLVREEQRKNEPDGVDQRHRINSIDLSSIGFYGNMDFWLPLRPRLKINDYGCKVLRVLEKHASDRRALEFVKTKSVYRSYTSYNNV